MKNKNKKSKIVIGFFLAVLVGCFFYFDLGNYLSLSELKTRSTSLQNFRLENPFLAAAMFV
ncbi:MAG: TVP38/TMEM64 family protein, partial [Pseudobdellovibrionaceae bacterium]